MTILGTPICRVWEADMAEARKAFGEGDAAWGHRCLRRAATARRWIAEDLRGMRRAVEAKARRDAAAAELRTLNRRLFRMAVRYDAQREAIRDRLAHIHRDLSRVA